MDTNKLRKNWYRYVLAFVLPVILLIIFLVWNDIYPFGNISNLRDDLEIQYVDYFAFYRNVLLGNGDISYSFAKSLGGSLVALWGYYLSSPFNLLIVFFSPERINLFVFVITALKLGLSGLTFYLFVRHKFSKAPWYVLLFLSCAYGFTQYNVGQMANLNWLDGVYMLPLMLLGVRKYVWEEKRTLFFISTACSIVFNWYTAYMNCIFVMLYFVYEQSLKDSRQGTLRVKTMFKNIVRFGLFEILSVALSMAVFLPVLLGQSGGRTFEKDIFEFRTNGSLLDVFNGFLIGSDVPSRNITLFCSILLLLFAVYFFWDKRIRKEEKIALGSFLGVMVASLFFYPLENIWCGFRTEESYEYRFLYLAIVVLLLMAGYVLEHFYELDRKTMFRVTAGLIGMFFVLDMLHNFSAKRLWFQIALLLIYCLLLVTIAYKIRIKRVFAVLCIFALFFGELSLNAELVSGEAYNMDVTKVISYISDEQKLIEEIKSRDNGFYRVEKTLNRDNNQAHNSFYANESMAYNTFGIQHYSSCYDESTSTFIKNLGYCRGVFPSFYHAPILPADSLLGIKYLLSETEYDGFSLLDGTSFYNNKNIYENSYALPIAFSTSKDILGDLLTQSTDAFEYMNRIYSSVLGENVDLFTLYTDYEMTVGEDEVSYYFDGSDEDEILFFSMASSNWDINLYWDDVLLTSYGLGWMNHNVLPLGNMGQPHELKMKPLPKDVQISFYSLSLQDFGKIINTIKQQSSVSDICVENGEIRFISSGNRTDYVMLTIPYDENWCVTVNGQSVQPQIGANALMVVPVSKGESVVSMHYKVKGVSVGICITVASVLIFVSWQFLRSRKKRNLHISKTEL